MTRTRNIRLADGCAMGVRVITPDRWPADESGSQHDPRGHRLSDERGHRPDALVVLDRVKFPGKHDPICGGSDRVRWTCNVGRDL